MSSNLAYTVCLYTLRLIHMACFAHMAKSIYGKKHICFSVHTICREHICSDIPCLLPGILYHHKFYVPTNLSTHNF